MKHKEHEEEIKEQKEESKIEEKDSKKEEAKDLKDALLKELENETKENLIKNYIDTLKINEKLSENLKIKEQESNDYLDKYKRALAELENTRKRSLLDKQDTLKYSNFNIIKDLLVLLDDFERATNTAKNEPNLDIKHFIEGIEMIEKQFSDLLFKSYGTVKFGETGDLFDPQLHQAMMVEEGDFKDETIIEVFRKGYKLHDRVLRHAQVKIGRPKE